MSITIELKPDIEARLCQESRTRGVDPEEIVRQLVESAFPPELTDEQRRLAQIVKNQKARELLRKWREEDASGDPDEIVRAEAEFEEFKRNMNLNRELSGERPIYP